MVCCRSRGNPRQRMNSYGRRKAHALWMRNARSAALERPSRANAFAFEGYAIMAFVHFAVPKQISDSEHSPPACNARVHHQSGRSSQRDCHRVICTCRRGLPFLVHTRMKVRVKLSIAPTQQIPSQSRGKTIAIDLLMRLKFTYALFFPLHFCIYLVNFDLYEQHARLGRALLSRGHTIL